MGFSGGGSNVLLPHTHDGRVAQDGGPLNFSNITQSQSAAGEVFYSDGVALQQLAYPGVPAGETLTAAALSTAPSWVAAGSTAGVELITSATQAVSDPYFTISFAPVTQATTGKFFGVCTGAKTNTSNNVLMYINGLTTSTYQYNWNEMDIGTLSSGYSSGSQWQVVRNYAGGTSTNFTIWFEIIFNTYADNIQFSTTSTTQDRGKTTSGTNTTAGQTSLSEVEFYQQNGAGNIEAGTFCAIYKTNL
jgi:hypothetical protein